MNFNTIQAVSFSLLQLCNESEAETVVTYNQLQLEPGVLEQCLQPSLCTTEGYSRESLVSLQHEPQYLLSKNVLIFF